MTTPSLGREGRDGRVVAIDGVIVPAAEAKVSVYDRGFLYGDAVFEVLRTYGGWPFALPEHVARLARSAELCLIAMPVSNDDLCEEVKRVMAASTAASGRDAYARVMVTRGSGPLGLDPDLAGAPLRVILVEAVVPPPRELYANGARLATVVTRRAVEGTAASGAKVSNYLSNLLAVREAKARRAQEALIVDARGHVVEGASSNVFVVRGRVITTPPPEEGILVGITRAHVLAAARALGLEVEEVTLVPEDLYGADEVFITSSIREVLPAVAVDDRVIGSGAPGEVTRALHRRFREQVGAAGPMPWEGGAR